MKKKFKFSILFASLGMMLGITSCKKDWNCDCSYTGSNGTHNIDTYPNTKRADAKKLCDATEVDLKQAYGSASCKIK